MKISQIIKNIKKLKKPAIDQIWLNKGRQVLQSFIATNPARPDLSALSSRPKGQGRRVRKPEFSRQKMTGGPFKQLTFKPMPIAIIALIITLVAGGGVVSAAQTSLPTDTLYPVKLATETIQEVLTFNPAKKIELQTKLATKRLEEIQKLQEKNLAQPEIVNKTLEKFENHLQKARTKLAALNQKVTDKKVASAALTLETAVLTQQEILDTIQTQAPSTYQDNLALAKETAISTSEAALGKIKTQVPQAAEMEAGLKLEAAPVAIDLSSLEQQAKNKIKTAENKLKEIRQKIDRLIANPEEKPKCEETDRQTYIEKLENNYQQMENALNEAKKYLEQKDYLASLKLSNLAFRLGVSLDSLIGRWHQQCPQPTPPTTYRQINLDEKFTLKPNEWVKIDDTPYDMGLIRILTACTTCASVKDETGNIRPTCFPSKCVSSAQISIQPSGIKPIPLPEPIPMPIMPMPPSFEPEEKQPSGGEGVISGKVGEREASVETPVSVTTSGSSAPSSGGGSQGIAIRTGTYTLTPGQVITYANLTIKLLEIEGNQATFIVSQTGVIPPTIREVPLDQKFDLKVKESVKIDKTGYLMQLIETYTRVQCKKAPCLLFATITIQPLAEAGPASGGPEILYEPKEKPEIPITNTLTIYEGQQITAYNLIIKLLKVEENSATFIISKKQPPITCEIPICENGREPYFTGEYDDNGCKIYKCPEKECVKEGETGPVYPGYQCCEGLQTATPSTPERNCEHVVGAFVCIKCGNGICGPGENSCNCPKDCGPSPTPQKPVACIELYDPVCGTDGKTYSNDCFAEVAGVGVACKGTCPCPKTGTAAQSGGATILEKILAPITNLFK